MGEYYPENQSSEYRIQKEDILARSVALMDGLLKTLQKMRQKPMEYWIKEAGKVAEKNGVDPISQNKLIP